MSSVEHKGADRIEAIDLARGIAIALMILSHGIKGLLGFDQIPAWGLVPVHLVTKISSSLFLLVFGISLSMAYVPFTGTPSWGDKRRRLLIRGIIILFWYKILTIVEMIHLYSREDILRTLSYEAFPVYAEILGFYAIALLWIPFLLPAWRQAALWARVSMIVGCAIAASFLSANFHFWGIEPLQAVLVEHERHYTWGQLSRAPLVFLGLIIGPALTWSRQTLRNRFVVTGALGAAGAIMLALFIWRAGPGATELHSSLVALAKNEGKHPPALQFLLFSLGGGFLALALAVLGGNLLAVVLRPLTIIGRNPLQAFVFHLFVLFVFYRYLFGYWHNVSYPFALVLTLLLLALTAVWVKVLGWIHAKS